MKDVNVRDGLQNTLAGLGTTRDKASLATYVDELIGEDQLINAYRTSWLARKIVDIPAMDMFREWRLWQAPVDQVEKLEEEERRLGLKLKLLKAYGLARLFGTCYVYFDFGDDPTKPLMPKSIKQGGIRFVTVLSHRQLAPGTVELDVMLPTFGEPQYYDVVSSNRGNVRIHPSRILRLMGATRPDDQISIMANGGRGDSVLQAVMQAVKQFDSTASNISSLIYESKVDVISVKGLMNLVGSPYEEQKLLERYRLAAVAKGNNGMLLLDGDTETYEQKQVGFAALPELLDKFALNASGAADIPMTRLFGRSPSGMSATGESDLRNYYDRISSNQDLELRPALSVLDEALIQSALGSRPPEVHYIWKSLWQVSDKERADIGAVLASIVKSVKETGLIPDEVLARVLVSMMTQDAVMPGLETEYDDFFASNKDVEEGNPNVDPEAEAALALAASPEGKKLAAGTKVEDEQVRAPKGTPNGGQWIKGSSGSGGSGAAFDEIEAAKAAALASVSNSAYPAEYIKTFLDKPNKELTQGQYKKALAYKKALQLEKTKLAAAKLPQHLQLKPKTTELIPELTTFEPLVDVPKTIDPGSPEAMKKFSEIAAGPGHPAMKPSTVQKLATGVIQPDPSKPYQVKVKTEAEAFLKGEKQSASTPHTMETFKGYSSELSAKMAETPPPVTPHSNSQAYLTKKLEPFSDGEIDGVRKYTGSTHRSINKHLRGGEYADGGVKIQIARIDGAISKSVAATDLVLMRGARSRSMSRWLSADGQGKTELKVGDTIVDPGFPSLTRRYDTASSFGGMNSKDGGFGFKISVPKGSPLLAARRLSSHPQEDEFILPRNTKFRVTNVNKGVITMDVVP